MNTQGVRDVLAVQRILNQRDADEADIIAELIQWADSRELADSNDVVATVVEAKPSKAKRSKATESRDSDTFEATPDPSDEPDF